MSEFSMQEMAKGRCFGYSLSTIRDDKTFQKKAEALVQEEYLARFKDTHRWGGVWLDLKYTEYAALFTRPAGAELLTKTARGDVIIFPHLDRGFKHLADFNDALERFRMRGIRMVIPELGLDTLTHQDLAAMIARLIDFDRNSRARNFTERIKDNWQEGRTTPGRRPPLGFGAREVDGVHYVIGDAQQRQLMLRMLEWAKRGWTPAQIATKLNIEEVKTPEGRPWNKVTVGHWVAAEQVIQSYEAHAHQSMAGQICPADLREMLMQPVLKDIAQGKREIPVWNES